MRTLFVLLTFAILRSKAQNEKNRRPFDNGHSFEVKLTVPGEPGNDYPIFHKIPKTSFSCSGKEPGYYADMETNCQVFRVCTFGSTYGYQSFLCPNGTLFNQAVYVCDWWMNVNCTKSKELYNYRSELGNLRKGPHFMRDIKKMITHPMRNPYDQTIAKDNLVIKQDYKPPNTFYSVSKNNVQKNFSKIISQPQENVYSTTEISTATTIPKTYYYSNYNIFPPTNKSFNSFQQQSQRSFPQQKIGSNSLQSQFSNKYSGQSSPSKTKNILTYPKYFQNIVKPIQSNQKVHFLNRHHAQALNENNGLVIKSQKSDPTQNTFGLNQSKLQLNQHILQDKELYSYKSNQARFSKDISNQLDTDSKQDLVSNDTSPTLIRKTLAFREIIKDPKNGTPRSKITFKTWIIRPTKSEKLSAEPTPYTYNTPQNPIDNIIYENNLNVVSNTSEESVDQNNLDLEPYEYNPPTNPTSVIFSTTETPLSLKTSVISSEPTKPSLLYLPPTPFNTPPVLYNLPIDTIQTQRQYLVPDLVQPTSTALYSSSIPSIQSLSNAEEPNFPLRKELLSKQINHKNLIFTDALLKNNLDTTVRDLLKDTSKLFRTISPNNIFGFKQEIQTIDYPDESYLPQNIEDQRLDKSLLQSTAVLPEKSKLIETPSIVLEPPIESYEYNLTKSNRLSYLSFIKQPSFPSIERTVSIKITMPQKIADFIFKKNVSDNLEILSTENTNNFVVANKMSNKRDSEYIPIGKLILNNRSNISPSQELLFSFLADSINAAQEYNDIAKQPNTQSTPTHSQFQYLNKKDLGFISKRIAQMTSEQFTNIKPSSNDQFSRKANQSTTNNDILNKGYAKIKTNSAENYHQKKTRQELIHGKLGTNSHLSNIDSKIQPNTKPIYSGELYQLSVPEVTKQFYNFKPQTHEKYNSNYEWVKNTENETIGKKYKQSQPEFKVIKSHPLPIQSSQVKQNQKTIDQRNTANNFRDNIFIPKDTIAAQIHDNTIGIIPHPLHKDKLVNYKKDQIYYIYTHLNNHKNTSGINKNNLVKSPFISKPNSKISELIYKIIPSIKYDLENDIEKHTKRDTRQEIGADVNYIINHSESRNTLDKAYQGPSSYNAPQGVIGNLELNQNSQELNEDVEKIDNYEVSGYPKISPTKRFLFRKK